MLYKMEVIIIITTLLQKQVPHNYWVKSPRQFTAPVLLQELPDICHVFVFTDHYLALMNRLFVSSHDDFTVMISLTNVPHESFVEILDYSTDALVISILGLHIFKE